MMACVTAATLNKFGAADHWLSEARDLARRVPDEPKTNWQSFAATNVGVWGVTVAVDRGESGSSVRQLAEQVQEDAWHVVPQHEQM